MWGVTWPDHHAFSVDLLDIIGITLYDDEHHITPFRRDTWRIDIQYEAILFQIHPSSTVYYSFTFLDVSSHFEKRQFTFKNIHDNLMSFASLQLCP